MPLQLAPRPSPGYNGGMLDFRDMQASALRDYLRRHVDGEVRFDATTRRLYSTDASIYQIAPAGVVIPRTPQALVSAVQIALETRMPVTARGGGTSLSGQSIGPGLIVDCSKYLNNIIDIDPTSRMARVQPGVVLDQFNRALSPYGLQFGPDVSTSSRANLGGMIGNNSAGARSIVYGKTIDHVRRLRVVLSDGSQTEFGPLGGMEWERRAEAQTLEGGIYREVRQIVGRNAGEIQKRFPKILRRVSGYNLDALLGRTVNLANLVVGSEGTLAVTTEAEVSLVAKPPVRGLLVPQFSSLSAALDALAACLEFKPSAVELMDQMLIDLSRNQRSLNEVMKAIPGRPAALLMVEFGGEDQAEISARIHELQRRLQGVNGLMECVPALDPALREPLWNLRRAAMPLLYGVPGERKPVTFIEDAAVAPERLPEFIARFREILNRHETDGAFYGHASVGCLHIRPLMNLHLPDEVTKMRRITEEITDLVLEFGGSLSGEHGDGLARSEWNRKMFGPIIYEAFREVKRAFDPHNLLNPGKIVNAPAMTENLRYTPHIPAEPPVQFDYSRQEGFFRSVEQCNGAGVCRKTQGGTMCPSFRATRDERDSTRGRANALRLTLVGEANGAGISDDPGVDSEIGASRSPLERRWLFDVMDLCLQCKACKTECPSNVDMAKLKAEFLNSYYHKRMRPLGHVLLGNVHRVNPWAAAFAPIVNRLSRSRASRWLMEMIAGIDRRRSLPRYHRGHFRKWFARHRPPQDAGSRPRVVLLDDCFTTFNEPQIGKAAVRILEAAGCQVELAGICCGRALISKGFLPQARELAYQAIPRLAQHAADGSPILGLEPSCLLTLVDEWPDLAPEPSVRRIADAAFLADHWLADQFKAGKLKLDLNERKGKVLLHGHCHQKALRGAGGSAAALNLIQGLEVATLDAGCCGMAGSFGYEAEHFDISEKIANLELLPALRAEPDALVAATGTSCRHQMHDLAGRTARHPLEIIAESLKSP
jgi:FAD/FMN-containing dehydrogenase/Fe-S oxidoreductase